MKKIPIILIIFNLISIHFSFFSIMCLSTWGWYVMRLLLCSGWERCTNGLCNNRQTNTIYSFLMSTARHRIPDRRTHPQSKAHAKDGQRSEVRVGRSSQPLLTLPHVVSSVHWKNRPLDRTPCSLFIPRPYAYDYLKCVLLKLH